MAPSLASSREAESIANMTALSIFVVTVAVNICIQIATGVIFSFIAEHIIILCFMFMLLAILWHNTFDLNIRKGTDLPEKNLAHFLNVPKGESSLMHRVKSWYISNSIMSPQLHLCKLRLSSGIGPICIMSSAVLLQATYRSVVIKTLEFCNGVSDYDWSVWIIVMTQIVATIIGSLTVAFQWLVVAPYLDFDQHIYAIKYEFHDLKVQFFYMKRRSVRKSTMVLFKYLLKLVLLVFLFFIHLPIFVIALIVYYTPGKFGKCSCCMNRASEDVTSSLGSWNEEFDVKWLDELSQRVLMLCVNNMNKWENVRRAPSSSYMVQMLSRPHLFAPPLLNKFLDFGTKFFRDYKVTCYSMVLLLKVGSATMPSNFTQAMRDTLHEAFEIVYYIDKKMNEANIDSRRRRHMVKLFWEGGDIDVKKISLKILMIQ
ncbi:hypothetical protein Scep_028368 [Stephania cephalantha]|uniref:Uncharacterized protein n=1 Tax=Stephania cephalantha TaxID=152367 RepID=A0AAP0E9U4_9MAGN